MSLFIDKKLLKKLEKVKKGEKSAIKTWSRNAVIAPEMVGYRFAVHNGKIFIEFIATEDMVGHKLGEFSPTTKFPGHGGKKAAEEDKKVKEKEHATEQSTT